MRYLREWRAGDFGRSEVGENLENFRILAVLIGLLGLVGLITWISKTPLPRQVIVANVTGSSGSLGWLTETPTLGCMVAYSSLRDVHKACDQGVAKTAHLVTFDALRPTTTYRLIALDGIRLTGRGLGSILTGKPREELPSVPRPAYGSIADVEGFPAAHTLVIVKQLDDSAEGVQAVVTNVNGGYALDLSNFKRPDGRFLLEAWNSPFASAEMEATSDSATPFPTFQLSSRR